MHRQHWTLMFTLSVFPQGCLGTCRRLSVAAPSARGGAGGEGERVGPRKLSGRKISWPASFVVADRSVRSYGICHRNCSHILHASRHMQCSSVSMQLRTPSSRVYHERHENRHARKVLASVHRLLIHQRVRRMAPCGSQRGFCMKRNTIPQLERSYP